MKKRKITFKRVLSLFLTICLLLTLAPAALAAPIPPDFTVDDLPSTDFKGYVFDYKIVKLGGKDAAKVTVSAYNVDYSVVYAFRFRYDATKVVPANKNNGNMSAINNANFVSVRNVTQSMINVDNAGDGNFAENQSLVGDGCFFGTVSRFDDSESSGTGAFKVDLMGIVANATSYDTNGIGGRLPQNEVIPLFEMYFIGLPTETGVNTSTTSIPADLDRSFLNVYADISYPKGYAAIDTTDKELPLELHWLNFPETTPPAPKTYPVKVVVGPTAANETTALDDDTTNDTWLESPAIQLWKANGINGDISTTEGYPRSFTSTTDAKGLLLENGTIVAEDTTAGSGVLRLEAGWYKYEVTPTGQTSAYAANTGVFEVALGDQNVRKQYIHAKAAGAADAKDFTLSVLDGESADRQTAFGSGTVKVTLGGADKGSLPIVNGQITLNTVPSDTAKTLVLEKTGYVTRTLTDVVFPTNGTITGAEINNGALVLSQKRSDITLTAPSVPAYFTISAKPGGTVTPNMAANELPMTVAAIGAENTATVPLPDGEYTYTLVTPGYGDMIQEMTVASNTATPKITITDVGGGNPKEVIPTVSGDGFTAKAPVGTPTTINDPMYQVVGEWAKTGETVTGMTVKVFVKNIKATQGTFGLRYDPAVFTLDTAGFTPDTKIQVPATQSIEVKGHKGSTANPTTGSGYHAFRWDAAGTGDNRVAVDGTAGAALIATYNLGLTSNARNDGYKAMMHDKSLYVQPYAKTVGATELKAVFDAASALDSYPDFIADLWRATDGKNTAPDTGRLTADKAMMGGFHQVTNATVEGDTWDMLSQFVFENTTGRPAIYFSVAEKDTNLAVKDATISVTQGADEVGTGKTDAFGDAIIPVPKEDACDYGVSAEGYQSTSGTVAPADMGKTVSVVLELSDMHKVRIHDSQTDSTALIGNGAQNGVDYYFMLTPQPGYVWQNGLPAADDLEIKLVPKNGSYDVVTAIPADKLTWDATKNQYKLDKSAITGVSTDDLVIKIKTSGKEPVQNADNYTVTVTAGTGGSFDYADVNPTSTFSNVTGGAIGTTGAKVTYVKEKLGTGEGISAKYTFKGNGPVDTTTVPDPVNAAEKYRAQVIDKFLVNGTAMKLTDYERIYGVKDYQLFGITGNSTIAVTFYEATVDPGKPGDSGDDTIDPTVPPTYPDEAMVTVILSDHGSAAVTVNNPSASGSLTGPGSGNYIVGATSGTLTATLTGKTGVTPPGGGAAVDYELDKVLINGIAPTSGQLSGNVLTLTDLDAGSTHQVVVTFKPKDGATIYASLELVRYAGDGTATPVGSSIWPVGLPAAIQLDPAGGWQLGTVNLKEPGGETTDVTKNAVAGSNTSYTYTTPSLKDGVTTVGFAFKEHTYKVEVLMNYAMRGNASVVPFTPATFTFTRTSGIPLTITYGPDETGDYKLSRPTQKESALRFDLPLGTWNLTVSKHGYLDYIVTDFVIAINGSDLKAGSAGDLTTVVDTVGTEPLIYFGRKGSEVKSRSVAPIIGDATWDGKLIAANDIGQVANGMVSGASDAQKARADLDESMLTTGAGTVNATDMSYVVENYGAVRTNLTYADFMNLSLSGS